MILKYPQRNIIAVCTFLLYRTDIERSKSVVSSKHNVLYRKRNLGIHIFLENFSKNVKEN